MVAAERSVRQEENQLRRLVDSMPAMIWRADPSGRIDRWNCTMIETIGKHWETSETFDLLSKIDPTQRAEVEERWAKSVRLGIPYEDTYRILGNDGRYHWHLVRAQPFRDDGGNIIGWYGVHADIDALKQAESTLKMREHELLHIIDTVPSMLWAASPTGEATHISRRLSEYSGWPLEKFLNFGWEKFHHPDEFETTARDFFRSIQTGESFDSVHRLRRWDGEYRWHHVMGEPLRDPEGKIIQWYGLSIDIDDRKKAEDHLRETRAKLNKASRIAMVAELSASIAHELNQPLTSVLANAQASKRWLAATPPNLEEATASLERVARDARSADQTMQNIRALFKRESFEKKETRVPEMVNEAVRLVKEDENKRGVSIQCIFDKDLPRVFVDPILIQELFINLISNAIEAMENIPREPKVTIRATLSADKEMEIDVIDNGPGVDDTEKIFDAFVTTKEKGMGIGLAVSRSIAEAHEGELSVANNADVGAKFTLKIPLPKSVTPH
jgi:PAS domain S-box-containing protein